VIDLRKQPDAIGKLAEQLASAGELSLLLDYDGTLVPIVAHPDLAAPGPGLLELLHELVRSPRVSVCVVSGRTRSTLNEWLGELPIVMFAEHGLWVRDAAPDSWHTNLRVDNAWKEQVRPILEEFVARTPGSLIEEKSAGIVWHFRGADPEFGLMQAKELHTHLLAVLAQDPVEILTGDKVLEIRPHGANKAAAVTHAVQRMKKGTLLAAFGDDRTDEDVFAALPAGALSFHVGMRPTRASHRLAEPLEVHALLKRLVELRRR
jgi:trehalose 6-phosphate synthase/phosphatase